MREPAIRSHILRSAFLPLALVAVGPAPSLGATYALITPPSALEVGCQKPCECPVVDTPTFGSFELDHTGSDGLFDHYEVRRFIASFNNGPGAVAILGSGSYRIGGEFALEQQLTLDLEIEGNGIQRFDSGLVPIGASFPSIVVSCAVLGFACYDSVLTVSGKPVDVAGVPAASRTAGLIAVWPNPFENQSRIAFALEHADHATLTIEDLAGRRVRELPPAGALSAGPQVVTWDGRRDDGRPAPAGIYWVRLRWRGGVDQRRVIKLE